MGLNILFFSLIIYQSTIVNIYEKHVDYKRNTNFKKRKINNLHCILHAII